MKYKKFAVLPLRANAYIVYNGNEGFIIDPGGSQNRLQHEIDALNLKITAVLLTHGHFDHCGAAAYFQRQGAKVYIHHADAEKTLSAEGSLAAAFGLPFVPFKADVLLHDGDIINIAGYEIKVIHTPGHTAGGVCYLIENYIFSGDTIFLNSVGRTDLGEDGDHYELLASIMNKLFTLKGDYDILPGHEENTTLLSEKENNPYLEFGWNKY